ncbi:MAG: WD40 repeat domain-containing protein, partial [Cyanobacteria bacterium J06600_6]
IELTGFNFSEAQPLLAGLSAQINNPPAVLQEILQWTRGQPFLTQKLCSLAVRSNQSTVNIPQLIQQHLIDNWEIQDEPEHLKTIRDRLLYAPQDRAKYLTLYQGIIQQQGLAVDSSNEQLELRLSGLVSVQQGQLKVSNPIYARVFNSNWIEQQLAAISPYQNAIAAWLKSGRQDSSRLLRGQALREGREWSRKCRITAEEQDFLRSSESLAIQEQKQAQLALETEIVTAKLVQEKRLVKWQRLLVLFSLTAMGTFYFQARQTNLSRIDTLVQSSSALFASNQHLNSLVTAISAKQQLNKSWRVNQTLAQKVDTALQRSAFEIKEYDRLLGHRDRIYSVAVAENDKFMATAATDNTVRTWRKTDLGWQAEQILQHDGWVVDVAISADNQQIASASRDRTVKLWNLKGKLLQTLNHTHPVTSVAFTKNNQIVTGTEDGTVTVWQQGKAIQTLTGHSAAVESLAIDSQGKIISGSEDGTIKIWQAGAAIQTLTGHRLGVRAVAITGEGKIISASRDNTLKIWSQDGTEIATLRGHQASVYSVAVDPRNHQIVSASADKTLKIWSKDGTEISTLKGHTNRIWDVAYLADSKIASVSWDKTIRLWQPNNGLVKTLSGHRDVAISLDYSQDLIASTSDDRTVRLWSPGGTLLKTFREHTAEVYDVAIHQRTIASVGADRRLKIWQADGNLLRNISAHQAAIWAVEISPDGNQIITAGNDNLIKIWDREGNLLHTRSGHTQKIWDLAISPQGDRFASASEDNTVKVWDLQGNLLFNLKGHQDAVRTVAFSDRGQAIISGSEDRSVKLWQLEKKTAVTLGKHQAAVKKVAISPDNSSLASVDDNGELILWQKGDRAKADIWQKRQTHSAHNNSIWSATFSADSKTLATAGEDHKVMLWNIDRIMSLDTLEYACDWLKNYLHHDSAIDSEGFFGDGRRDRQLCK